MVNAQVWNITGGTSFASPQIAAAATIVNQLTGRRVGFWNQQIYGFATGPTSPFNVLDATSSHNLAYTDQPGKLYNQATGLGTINFPKLLESFQSAGH